MGDQLWNGEGIISQHKETRHHQSLDNDMHIVSCKLHVISDWFRSALGPVVHMGSQVQLMLASKSPNMEATSRLLKLQQTTKKYG